MDKTIEAPPNGKTDVGLSASSLTPRQRQRLAEDEIEAIEQKYNVRIMGMVKTVNGGQQVITWEAVALPDIEKVNQSE